ncbi:OmpH family outer membrane protein [Chitinophaga lutea]
MYNRQLFVKNGLILAAFAGIVTACQQSGKPAAAKPGTDSSAQVAGGGAQLLAYVDIDSVEAHYEYFKQKKSELDKAKETAQNEIIARERQLQAELATLQQRAPTMTQSEGEAAQASLQKKAQQFDMNRQTKFAQIQEQEAQFNEDLIKRLDESIKRFNADKKYAFIFSYRAGATNILYKDNAYDVTDEVVKELNTSAPKK